MLVPVAKGTLTACNRPNLFQPNLFYPLKNFDSSSGLYGYAI